MNKTAHQLDLFKNLSLNPTYEIKRQIRLALAGSYLSRNEIADRMNEISAAEGMRKSITKAQIDNWAKDSDPDRLPSLPWLTIFCVVMNTAAPITAMIRPLGAEIISGEDALVLKWGRAEIAKKDAMKRARLALEAIE